MRVTLHASCTSHADATHKCASLLESLIDEIGSMTRICDDEAFFDAYAASNDRFMTWEELRTCTFKAATAREDYQRMCGGRRVGLAQYCVPECPLTSHW